MADFSASLELLMFFLLDTPYSIFAFLNQFIFSTSVDGNIKAWLYDNCGARVDYDAPGLGCTSLAYSADDRRSHLLGLKSSNILGSSYI